MSRPIRTTWLAREARRQARLALLSEHDGAIRSLRSLPPAETPEQVEEIYAACVYHLNRMEYHLDMIEAGR